jgi:hypothetical protein
MVLEQDDDPLVAMQSELSRLKQEHRDLDSAIDALDSMAAGTSFKSSGSRSGS